MRSEINTILTINCKLYDKRDSCYLKSLTLNQKTMKTKIIFYLILILGLSFTGCKKYEEGPALSLRSKTARVANTWKVELFTINGIDNTSALTSINYSETYDKDGNYSYNSSIGTGSGKWEFQSNKEQIKRSGVSGQSTETLYILRLKEKEFWYYYLDGNNKFEIHLAEN